MSFDLILLPEPAGQTWEEALENERQGTDEPLDLRAWDEIVAGVRDIAGEVVVRDDGRCRTLIHEPSGLTVRYEPGEAAVNVPYWYTGAQAESVVRAVYRIGWVVAKATGLAGYDPQLELPLADAESRIEAAVAVFDRAALDLSQLQAALDLSQLLDVEYMHVYFTGQATLADAARQLDTMPVAEEDGRLTVQWADGPEMRVTFNAKPEVAAEAAELADEYALPVMRTFDRRFEVTFDDLDEVLDDINTLIEVQGHLQDLTGGYVVRSWNRQVSAPYSND
ncbi:hypothetical protein ACFYON_00615 [Micromonospora sp. NPDC005686]|uniref:hypothetical protein n=1 Tax=unclassified Micromonospora TaxID=2617518 RepID=UPI0033BAE938